MSKNQKAGHRKMEQLRKSDDQKAWKCPIEEGQPASRHFRTIHARPSLFQVQSVNQQPHNIWQAESQAAWDLLNQNLHFRNIPRGWVDTAKFKKHQVRQLFKSTNVQTSVPTSRKSDSPGVRPGFPYFFKKLLAVDSNVQLGLENLQKRKAGPGAAIGTASTWWRRKEHHLEPKDEPECVRRGTENPDARVYSSWDKRQSRERRLDHQKTDGERPLKVSHSFLFDSLGPHGP